MAIDSSDKRAQRDSSAPPRHERIREIKEQYRRRAEEDRQIEARHRRESLPLKRAAKVWKNVRCPGCGAKPTTMQASGGIPQLYCGECRHYIQKCSSCGAMSYTVQGHHGFCKRCKYSHSITADD